jgi:hypothetical protein
MMSEVLPLTPHPKPSILVFRDKLLLPSEGFIQSHYKAFDQTELVFLANRFGWRAEELEGQRIATGVNEWQRFWFKQLGHTAVLRDLVALAPQCIHAHFGRGGALALPLAKALKIPLYVTFHGGDATKNTHHRLRLIPTIYQRRLKALHHYSKGFFLCFTICC